MRHVQYPLSCLRFIPLLFLLGNLTACVHDDTDNCLGDLRLRFTYTHNKPLADLFRDQVKELDLFIYHTQTGEFLRRVHATTSHWGDNQTVTLNLAPGSYTIVAWGNLNPHYYDTHFEAPFADAYLRKKLAGQQDVGCNDINDLFHGTCQVDIPNRQTVYQDVALIKNTNNIHIFLYPEGEQPKTRSTPDLHVSIAGPNGHYNFNNVPHQDYPLNYMPTYMPHHAINVLQADFKTLRLLGMCGLRVRITEPASAMSLYDLPLWDELTKDPLINCDDDLDRYDDYFLYYTYKRNPDGSYVISLIQVNNWDVVNPGGGSTPI